MPRDPSRFGVLIYRARAGDSKDLEATPQGKAYRAQEKAIKAGDYEAYKKTMTKASAAGMDKQTKEMNMDSKKAMEFMKAMLPTDSSSPLSRSTRTRRR